MEKVCARISEMPNRCKLVVESSGGTRYSNIEEEIGYFGVLPEYAPVPSILTPRFLRSYLSNDYVNYYQCTATGPALKGWRLQVDEMRLENGKGTATEQLPPVLVTGFLPSLSLL